MYQKIKVVFKLALLLACFLAPATQAGNRTEAAGARDIVERAILPVKQEFSIPGMAVAITVNGRSAIYNFGVMSATSQKPVTNDTLFEIGSLSKTLTATLASLAQVHGHLSLTDTAATHLPALRSSAFDDITLLQLATHTSGLPLFTPDKVGSVPQFISYLKAWKPAHPAGFQRVYSNNGTGLLGMVAARSMGMSYESAVEEKVFRKLGMNDSYFQVPEKHIARYAQGHTAKGTPVRLNYGFLAAESYGLKTTASDLIGFVEANMKLKQIDADLQRAMDNTHVGYIRAGETVQGLMWEQYAYPTALETLLAGNASTMALQPRRANWLEKPEKAEAAVLINKTGSTNGFANYAAFIPSLKLGIVILANKNYPAEHRVRAAYQILRSLTPS